MHALDPRIDRCPPYSSSVYIVLMLSFWLSCFFNAVKFHSSLPHGFLVFHIDGADRKSRTHVYFSLQLNNHILPAEIPERREMSFNWKGNPTWRSSGIFGTGHHGNNSHGSAQPTNFSSPRIARPLVSAAKMADSSKPIAFCEHLQLSSLGIQPASISFQVRTEQ